MDNDGRYILVVCGPPCSGKSSLVHVLTKHMPGLRCHEMDSVRIEILPGQINDEPRRSAAYRVMHFRAGKDLDKYPVLLSATYQPPKARAELASLAMRLNLPLYVVQCICSADEAVERFRRRETDHAAVDLTSQRVKELSEQYRAFDGALLIDTTKETAHLAMVRTYVDGGNAADPILWAQHKYLPDSVPRDAQISSPEPAFKLSESSVRVAHRWHRRYGLGLAVLFVSFLLGLIPIIQKFLHLLTSEYGTARQQHAWYDAAGIAIIQSWSHSILFHGLGDWAAWATFCLAFAGFGSIVIALWRDTKDHRAEVRRIRTAGNTPRYAAERGQSLPSDAEIYHAYRCRIVDAETERLPIPNAPLFFQVLPRLGHSFSAIVRTPKYWEKTTKSVLFSEGAKLGMDWAGFVEWRRKTRREEYSMAYSHEYGLRCLGLRDQANDVCCVSGAKCTYDDYACGELAVNLSAPGSLPDMRRLLEGNKWDAGSLDLLDVSESAKRYSMRLNVTGLVLTADDFFVLQRRSGMVGHGLGSLAASVNGAADYYADSCDDLRALWLGVGKAAYTYRFLNKWIGEIDLGPREWNLASSALRELHEEIGLNEGHLEHASNNKADVPSFDEPFIGAGYNLRHGRDLNFYCCFRTWLNSWQLGAERRNARDKWEVEHLVFLPRDLVSVKAIVSGELDKHIPNRARHLLGVLYAWAVYANRI